MYMLNVRLNEDEEQKLDQVLTSMKVTNKSELVKRLINDQWTALQAGKTFLERRGEHPKYLLSESDSKSERSSRKDKLAEHYDERAQRRHEKSP
ncbi:MAG: hypothetical protein K2X29_01435 [Candidatus Obscuribacterales bacterium]|nr:hypothetical protein [Candidatus Obscuribacterales bacterium]